MYDYLAILLSFVLMLVILTLMGFISCAKLALFLLAALVFIGVGALIVFDGRKKSSSRIL